MNLASGALLSLAYILGLLSTAIFDSPTHTASWQAYSGLALGLVVLGGVAAIAFPKFSRTGTKPGLWLASGIIAALAVVYFQLRTPQPASNDVSQFIRSNLGTVSGQVVTVQGKVDSIPRLTRSQQSQFWLETTQLNEVESSDTKGASSRRITGKLYVTVPLLQATGLYPGEPVAVTGVLYKPKPPANPGAFDFAGYLAKEGAFAGLRGHQISGIEQQTSPWGWWVLRQRITRSQMRGLGSPIGQLVSSIVLGSRAVDIPYDIRDQFIQAGLAHTLAASGTQTSLILGLVLVLTKRLSVKVQLVFGTAALMIFVGLTGLQPSVMRAALMGFGALVALVTQRKVKPLGSLLVAATLLLLFNPLWIWDLGFQLSFLAVLGLLVTVPPLAQAFDWLPPAIAVLITVPVAAALWTLPLQLFVFGIIAPYSIVANIIAAPLIAVISIAGAISALAALISPSLGSALASPLYYPTQLLIELVKVFSNLPGHSVAVGTISVGQLLLLYGLLGLCCINSRVRRRWWVVGLVALALVALPVWHSQTAQFQATVLATAQEQVLVIQDRGKVGLVNSGEEDTTSFTVLPFLQKQGVNQIDWAVALDLQPRLRSGWLQMLASLPIQTFYDTAPAPSTPAESQKTDSTASPAAIANVVQSQQGNYQILSTGQSVSLGSTPIELINTEPPVLQMQLHNQTWLLLGDVQPDTQKQLAANNNLSPVQVLWWSGEELAPELIKTLQPQVAIASANSVNSDAAKLLHNAKISLYWTGRDGAIQWTPEQGFETTLEAINRDAPLL